MHVPTGNLYGSLTEAMLYHPAGEVVEIRGTREQVEALSRATKRVHADDAKRKARRQTQASRRANR